jgi:hypothetical protein
MIIEEGNVSMGLEKYVELRRLNWTERASEKKKRTHSHFAHLMFKAIILFPNLFDIIQGNTNGALIKFT